MSLELTVLYTALFFMVSTTCVMVGIGGGLFYVMLLVWAGFPFAEAVPGSLMCIVLGGAAGAVRYWRKGHVDVRLAVCIGLGAIATAFGVGWLSVKVPEDIRLGLFVLFSMMIGISMLRKDAQQGCDDAESSPSGNQTNRLPVAGVLLGGMAGTASAFMGIGGGVVLVPALRMAFRLSMLRAVSTSAATLSLTALAGVLGHWHAMGNQATVSLAGMMLPLAIGSFAGGLLGANLAVGRMKNLLRQVFVVVLMVLVISLLIKRFI